MRIPTRDEIFEHFKLMGVGKYPEFMEMVDDNVNWTIMGWSKVDRSMSIS